MPNLENLRKQAKLYLRWHRDGHYPVAAQIRAVLPRFRDLTRPRDPAAELQARRCAGAGGPPGRVRELAGAQDRSASHDRQPKTTVTATPALNAAEPNLFVADFEAACAFYTDKLGFEIVFTYGEPPFYGQIRRGQALLNLRLIRRAGLRRRHPRA